ncbi:PadR family transcriptional regulator [Actinomycetospora sp. CA-053990]|uniref:PadR family transcriptional regulator n=1 Tax=Actinomycetospora sp. CA-053990 TaxID=3239891 RepID=UPI003D8F39D2
MTTTAKEILRILVRLHDERPQEWIYGLQIAELGDGLLPSSTYPVLQRLVSLGWLDDRWEDIDTHAAKRARRRFYRFTPDGLVASREALAASDARQRAARRSVRAPRTA